MGEVTVDSGCLGSVSSPSQNQMQGTLRQDALTVLFVDRTKHWAPCLLLPQTGSLTVTLTLDRHSLFDKTGGDVMYL